MAIARALVVEPDLPICDEVTAALDMSVQAIVVELVRRLQRERALATLFITHNLALVRSIGQDVVLLCDGNLIETGPIRKALDEPKEEYTVRLVKDAPALEDAALSSHDVSAADRRDEA